MFKILNNITLINVNNINPKLSVNILNFCNKFLKFNKTILFSEIIPENITSNIEHVPLKINSILDYNKFILKDLNNFINTSHCLIVQNDGFIINPHLWKEEFLEYDYIGAPWNLNGMRVWKRTNRIGNGGFSLRSKKLLQYTQQTNLNNFNQPEDVTNSLIIEKNKNFKYPSVDLAVTFSLEDPLEDFPYDFTKCFGFHSKWVYNNLIHLCPNVFNLKNA
jgi:hypothetical protein